MLDHTAIRRAFRERLLTTTGLPAADRRSWENVTFQPPSFAVSNPADALWIRETLLPTAEILAATGTFQAIGEYRIDVFTPAGLGVEAAEALAFEIAKKFEPKGGFSGSNGTVVSLIRTSRAAARVVDDAWLMLPVIVDWVSFSPSS